MKATKLGTACPSLPPGGGILTLGRPGGSGPAKLSA